MRYLIFLSVFLGFCSLSSFGQQASVSQCTNLNAIVTQMQEWRKKYTVIKFPIGNKRRRPLIGHPFLERSGLDGGTGAYYSSSAVLVNEYASEFGIDNEGQCFYIVYMGPYSKEIINNEGEKLKNTFLSCINKAYWRLADIPDTYLYANYNPIDISVSIIKRPIKNSNNYTLIISMYRFTPLK